MTQLTRQELYDLVWSKPMKDAASKTVRKREGGSWRTNDEAEQQRRALSSDTNRTMTTQAPATLFAAGGGTGGPCSPVWPSPTGIARRSPPGR